MESKPRRKPSLRERLTLFTLRTAFRTGSRLAPELTASRALHFFMTPTRIPRPGWEKELLKSAKPITLKAGVAAYSWGEGPRVLLVHGWDGRGTQMGRIASAIASAGFEAVCIDLPGHGNSPDGIVHVPGVKALLLKIGEELGDFHTVIGHSFGASATLYALHEGLAAGRMVYLAGPSRFTDLFDRFCEYFGVSGRARKRFQEKIFELVDMHPEENYPAVWVRNVSQPALIVHDHDDEDCPFSEGEEMHANWQGSKFLETKGLGHRRVLKSKEIIAAILQFMKNET